jgi:hypothetical protein
MRLLRETSSIEDAPRSITDPELRELIEGHIDRLSEYDDYQLSELIHIIVVEIGDCYAQLGPFIGSTPEVVQEHSDWYELVYVISDDGFGVVVFVPKDQSTDPRLLAICRQEPIT